MTTSSLPSAEPTTLPSAHEDTPTVRHRHSNHQNFNPCLSMLTATLRNSLLTVYKVVPFLTSIYTHTLSHLQCTHPLSSALSPQVKRRLQLLVVQPLFDVHQWTSATIHLLHHIGLELTDTHNLSHKLNLR